MFPILTDETQHAYRLVDFGTDTPAGRAAVASISPGDKQTDVIVFELPAEGANMLHLEIPAGICGAEGAFKFAIPTSVIVRPE